ncbi:MAG: mccF [Gammaproteobacteria bacterium]|jgi:muramoyltetrapeptide carboxypeptidase|nr:mccF [Gammaproteobacteria bacterium]
MWPLISRNEFVDILAPSGKVSQEDINIIREYLLREGFKPRIPENILGEHPFSANSDALRFEHLKNALNAEDSTLLWCVRGGQGVTSIMPELTQLAKPEKQKLLVGFSDITSLHLWLNQAWQWPSLHGPMARMTSQNKIDSHDVAALNHLWFEGLQTYSLDGLQALNEAAKEAIIVEGKTIGTCLSLLQTSIGTPWQFDACDKILFLEDINEQPYRIYRSLIYLINTGLLNQAKALIFGDFGESDQEAKDMEWALNDIANVYLNKRGLNLPVFRLRGFGHGPRNKPIPLGVRARIESDIIKFGF